MPLPRMIWTVLMKIYDFYVLLSLCVSSKFGILSEWAKESFSIYMIKLKNGSFTYIYYLKYLSKSACKVFCCTYDLFLLRVSSVCFVKFQIYETLDSLGEFYTSIAYLNLEWMQAYYIILAKSYILCFWSCRIFQNISAMNCIFSLYGFPV